MSHASVPTQIVFIVSGDSHLRQMLHSLVASSGLQAVTFGSAAEYREGGEPDTAACLILDVDLPDMSGLDLQREVARTDVPIVFVTNQSDVRSGVRAIKEGAFDFLTTPFRDSDLLHAVHAAIAQYRDTRSLRTDLARLQQHFALLTPREREVLTLVVSGLLNKQSACELGISEVTLQIHRRRIMQKMAASSLADLVRMATILQIPLARCDGPRARTSRSPGVALACMLNSNDAMSSSRVVAVSN